MNSLGSQLRFLRNIEKEVFLDFDLFCNYHDQRLSDKHQGSIRDGYIVRSEILVSLMGDDSRMILDVISAYWDAVYRFQFSGLVDVIYDKQLHAFPEIESVELLESRSNTKKFVLNSFYEDVSASIIFRDAKVYKFILKEGLTRDALTIERA